MIKVIEDMHLIYFVTIHLPEFSGQSYGWPKIIKCPIKILKLLKSIDYNKPSQTYCTGIHLNVSIHWKASVGSSQIETLILNHNYSFRLINFRA
jgi:hypothetical protein